MTGSGPWPPGGPTRRSAPLPAPLPAPLSAPTSGPAAPAAVSGLWLSVLLGLVMNLATLAGVAFWGWPAGNVFLLFWIENVVLGLWTIPKIATARGGGGRMPMTVNGRPRQVSGGGAAVFFCLHYGLFCTVHLVFTALVAWKIGLRLDFWTLGLPALLIMVRYSVESMITWFGPGHRRDQVTPAQAMGEPYPRIVVLQLATIVCFGLFVVGRGGWVDVFAQLRRAVTPWLGQLSDRLTGDAVFAVLILVLVKTAADGWLTVRALRRRG